MMLYSHIALL